MGIASADITRIGKYASEYLLVQPREGVVVSRFRHGFSVLFDEQSDPGLVTFQVASIPLHPWAIEIRDSVWPEISSACRQGGTAVVIAPDDRCVLASVDATDLKIRPWRLENANHAGQRVPRLQQFIEQFPSLSTVASLDLPDREALRDRALIEAVDIIIASIGRGPGSTPSGDDYLVGQLAVQWALHRTSERARRQLKDFQRLCQWDHLKERTPIGSAQMILAAADGQFPEPVCNIMRALGMPPSQGFFGPARVLALQGVTSGTAMLAGILDGLEVLAF